MQATVPQKACTICYSPSYSYVDFTHLAAILCALLITQVYFDKIDEITMGLHKHFELIMSMQIILGYFMDI